MWEVRDVGEWKVGDEPDSGEHTPKSKQEGLPQKNRMHPKNQSMNPPKKIPKQKTPASKQGSTTTNYPAYISLTRFCIALSRTYSS